MAVLIVICVLLVVGFYFLMRSSPEAKGAGSAISDADALLLRTTVQQKLRERLVGWSVEPGPDGPLELVAEEAGSERRKLLKLDQLAELWLPLQASGATEEADGVIEDFIEGVTGEREGEEATGDNTWVHAALALRLVRADAVPRNALTRPAGSLLAVLVLRNPEGPEPIGADELESWGLDQNEAFRLAFENLAGDAEDSLLMDPIGFDNPPVAYLVAPGDPIASSYALVPKLPELLRKRFPDASPKLFVGERALVATTGDVAPEAAGKLLLEGAQQPDALVWSKAPVA